VKVEDAVAVETKNSVVKVVGPTLKMGGSPRRSLQVLQFHTRATVQLMFPTLKTDRHLPAINQPLWPLRRLVGPPERRN